MIINYLGVDFFKIQQGNLTIAVNPVSKSSSLKTPRFGSDIALISLANNSDLNGSDSVSIGDKNPFVASGPGEYEVSEIFIKGLPSLSSYGNGEQINTIYSLSVDGINLCFLGALENKNLPAETVEALGDIDILFTPIGGEGTLSPADAYALSVSLEPKIIIPSHWAGVGSPIALKQFLKEYGESVSEIDKLTIKKKDLDGKEAEVVVLSAQVS